MKFRLTANELTAYLTSVDAVAKGIESQALGGSVVREEKKVTSVRLTDSSEHLAEYFKSPAGANLFGEGSEDFLPSLALESDRRGISVPSA